MTSNTTNQFEHELNNYFNSHFYFLKINRLEVMFNEDIETVKIDTIIESSTESKIQIPDDSELERILKQLTVENIMNS